MFGRIKALPREHRHAVFSGAVNSAYMKFLIVPSDTCNQTVSRCCNEQTFVAVTDNPRCFERTTTPDYFWQGNHAGRGLPSSARALYCINVTGCTLKVQTLIGCWAVITTSNNDGYFKENR